MNTGSDDHRPGTPRHVDLTEIAFKITKSLSIRRICGNRDDSVSLRKSVALQMGTQCLWIPDDVCQEFIVASRFVMSETCHDAVVRLDIELVECPVPEFLFYAERRI